MLAVTLEASLLPGAAQSRQAMKTGDDAPRMRGAQQTTGLQVANERAGDPAATRCAPGETATTTTLGIAEVRPSDTASLRGADLDGDGRLSRSEFMRMQERVFDRLPKDRDGLVRLGGAAPRARDTTPPAATQPTPPPSEALRPDTIEDSTPGAVPVPTEAAGSRSSTPSSTPSSTSPQEKKPGQR